MRKGLLICGLLAVLLLSMVGVPMVAAANANTMVKGNVNGMTINGYMIGGQPVGKATFDTQSGAWSLTTTKTLPYTNYYYYFGITKSKPVKGIPPEITDILTIPVDDKDYIDQSGTVSDSTLLSELNQNIANGGVFYLNVNIV
jgi:hypothetical protein